MESNGTGGVQSSYYHHHHHHPPPQPQPPQSAFHSHVAAVPASPSRNAADIGPIGVFPGSAPFDSVRKKRGRPRKYISSELGGPPSSSLSRLPPSTSSPKNGDQFCSGNVGQFFTPHIINVCAGEDVAQKIMLFLQQSKQELCILSASGSIANASLGQPATSGGNVTVEGRFEILSLCGSYVRTEIGGRSGGLSVCLSYPDGQIFGGVVGGPLKAAGPVQVIVGTFVLDTKKEIISSGGRFRVPEAEFGHNVSGNPFIMQPCGKGDGSSPENGSYD